MHSDAWHKKIYLAIYACLAEVLDWIQSYNSYQPTSLVPRPFEGRPGYEAIN